MIEIAKTSLGKPSVNTPFHIDFDWWKQHDNNWRVHLQSCLCGEHKAQFPDTSNLVMVDWIDPNTAEVTSVDGLQHVLMTHCAVQADFITGFSTLVDSTFRLLLANGNTPLTPTEIEQKLDKPAETILRTFSGRTVFKGIRPYQA